MVAFGCESGRGRAALVEAPLVAQSRLNAGEQGNDDDDLDDQPLQKRRRIDVGKDRGAGQVQDQSQDRRWDRIGFDQESQHDKRSLRIPRHAMHQVGDSQG